MLYPEPVGTFSLLIGGSDRLAINRINWKMLQATEGCNRTCPGFLKFPAPMASASCLSR